jgi:hypothetical protein
MNIKLNPLKYSLFLAIIASILLVIYLALLLFIPEFNASEKEGVVGLFNLNNEVSIPTWFSQIILFLSAVILFAISISVNSWKKYWKYLGFIFIYLSVDEGAAIHELTVFPMRDLLNIQYGPLYYTWVVLFGALFLILVLIYFKFYLNLPRRTQAILLLSAVIFISGAIGMEMVGSNIAARTGEISKGYSFATAAEEYFEMMGVTLFIYGLLDYFVKQKLEIKIR